VGDAIYDTIGRGYAGIRRSDPRLARIILDCLDGSSTVLNVGAGAGSYEPEDRSVVALEPSTLMIEQRPDGAAPVIQGMVESLPLADKSVDACMSVLSIQHWSDWQAGLAELERVARRQVVTVTIDTDALASHWMMRDYCPEILEVHAQLFPTTDDIVAALPQSVAIPWPVPSDSTDRFLAGIWAHPELFLDPEIRRASSAWHLIPEEAKDRAIAALEEDLRTGRWDAHYCELRQQRQLDIGMRVVTSQLAA
jgi:SAM-dependent methyltransferase